MELYIYVNIIVILELIMLQLYLGHKFYNKVLKIKHKCYLVSSSLAPPPRNLHILCWRLYHIFVLLTYIRVFAGCFCIRVELFFACTLKLNQRFNVSNHINHKVFFKPNFPRPLPSLRAELQHLPYI
jgi:hypothetical protein